MNMAHLHSHNNGALGRGGRAVLGRRGCLRLPCGPRFTSRAAGPRPGGGGPAWSWQHAHFREAGAGPVVGAGAEAGLPAAGGVQEGRGGGGTPVGTPAHQVGQRGTCLLPVGHLSRSGGKDGSKTQQILSAHIGSSKRKNEKESDTKAEKERRR